MALRAVMCTSAYPYEDKKRRDVVREESKISLFSSILENASKGIPIDTEFRIVVHAIFLVDILIKQRLHTK